MRKVITNIEEVKKQLPALLRKCLSYFMGVDRTIEGWEGLLAAQECIPTNKEKDAFAADYRVLNRAWDALSPDPYLDKFKFDYVWLSNGSMSINEYMEFLQRNYGLDLPGLSLRNAVGRFI